ncbi:MAG: VWA domain-containing protein [Spirochaetota bacterium]
MKNYNLISVFFVFLLLVSYIAYIWVKLQNRQEINGFLKIYPKIKEHMVLAKFSFLLCRFTIYLLLLILLSLAVLNPNLPVEGKEALQESSNSGVDIVFLVDVSLSMNAIDSQPTRIATFKRNLLRILPELHGNRFGMIAFAGNPFLYCPMTNELSTFTDYVRGMDVNMIPDTSTDIVAAFEKAEAMLTSKKVYRNRLLVVVTDGENMNASFPKDVSADVIIFGVGTAKGGNIYYRDPRTNASGFITKSGILDKKKASDLILTKLDEGYLKKLADVTDASYINLTNSPNAIYHLQKKITGMKMNVGKSLQSMLRKDSYQYFLYPAVFFLLLDLTVMEIFFRRKVRRF